MPHRATDDLGILYNSAAKLRFFSEWNDHANCPLDELRGINDEVRGLLFEEERVALYIVNRLL